MIRLSLAVFALGAGLAVTAAQAQQQSRPSGAQTTQPASRTTQPATRAPQPATRAQQPAQAAPPAQQQAQVPSGQRLIGKYDSWTAIEMVERAGKICYIVAHPSQKEPRNVRRDDNIMVSVSHRPSANQRNQVSYHAGYPYKAGLPVTMEIEKRKFELFTRPEVDNDAAWTPDESVDQAIIAAMRAGKTMTVIGTSARGTKTTDTIPLAGFSRALTEINKACNVR